MRRQSSETPEVPARGLGQRLQARLTAIDMSQAELAEALGTSESNVSRIINEKEIPGAGKLSRIARIVGVPVSYLYGENPSEITPEDHRVLERFAQWIESKRPKIDAAGEPNAVIVAVFTGDREHRRLAPRPKSTEKSEYVADGAAAAEFEIPKRFWDRRARLVARVSGTSMIDAGIDDGDLLYVIEETRFEAAVDKVVICRVANRIYAKRLIVENKRASLISANSRYSEIETSRDDAQIIGIVIGASGAIE